MTRINSAIAVETLTDEHLFERKRLSSGDIEELTTLFMECFSDDHYYEESGKKAHYFSGGMNCRSSQRHLFFF